MPRFNIVNQTTGSTVLDIPETEPILITGWLITNPPSPTEDAVLSAVDANGDVFTANGMRVPFETEYGGANIEIRVDPTVTVTLSGNGAAASIYYERLKWVVDSQP